MIWRSLVKKVTSRLKSNYRFVIFIVCLSLLSVVHILPPFCKEIINYDSAYQYCLTLKSPSEIALLIPEDYSPPLYTVFLKLWTLIFGESLFAMRASSLLVLWGMLFLAIFPIRKAFGDKTAVLCAFFFSFTSINYVLVPEIRPTVLAYFFVTAACIYCYLAFIEDKSYAHICFAVFSVCAMYTHNIGMLAALAFYITALTVSLIKKEYGLVKRFFTSGMLCAVCYVPWLFVVFKQFKNVKKNYWSKMPDGIFGAFQKSFLPNFYDFGNGYIRDFLELAVPLCVCVLIIIGAMKLRSKKIKKFSEIDCLNFWKHREKYSKILFCVSLYLLPFVLWELFSLIFHPIMATRYYYIFSGTSMMFFAVLTVRFGKNIGMIALSLISAANFCLSTFNLKRDLENSAFLDMIEYIEGENSEGETAFLHAHEWTLGIMMYYFPDAKHYISDDTWCVLNTLDVFPSEAINVGSSDKISDFEEDFYIFGGTFPDTGINLSEELTNSGKFASEVCFECKEPYTYQKGWNLIYVKSKGIS